MRANRGPSEGFTGELPLNGSFFCCVDFRNFRYVAEQIAFDVVEEERLGVGIREVQAVVINDLGLFLQPFTPAALADFGGDALAELVWKWCEGEARALLAAMCAFDVVWHFFLLLSHISPIGHIGLIPPFEPL